MNTIQPDAPAAVRWITRTLEDAGHPTWAVGGAIRDALLGRRTVDWDLATRATPQEVRRLFRRTVPIGIEHGTVGILARDGVLYETTTFRKDVATDGRHAVVEFADSIEDDLARRDFTINAIAWHPIKGEFRDPFFGAEDLARGVLRTVGVAAERFREDYLRILRALRFAGRFGLEVAETTWTPLKGLVEHLPTLSAERTREELLKVLSGDPRPGRALQLYGESGALRVLYCELDAVRADSSPALTGPTSSEGRPRERTWGHALRTVECLPRSRVSLRLAALLRILDPAATAAILMRLRLSNALSNEVARLANAAPLPAVAADDAAVRRWLSVHGVGLLTTLARLELASARAAEASGDPRASRAVVEAWRRARDVRRTSPPLAVGDLALDGRGLISLGMRPGPGFGECLEGLLEWVLEDPARNERSLLEAHVVELEGGRRGDG